MLFTHGGYHCGDTMIADWLQWSLGNRNTGYTSRCLELVTIDETRPDIAKSIPHYSSHRSMKRMMSTFQSRERLTD